MSTFVLQTTNQSLAHRLWRYAAAPRDSTFFYPEGICEEVRFVHACTLEKAVASGALLSPPLRQANLTSRARNHPP